MIDPLRTRAVVVGIERYDLGESWNLDGPARDACRFVEWLLAEGVPAGNIRLHVSPLAGNAAEVESHIAGQLDVRPAGFGPILNSLLDVGEESSDLLVLFWGGHGVRPPTEFTHLLCADAQDRYRSNHRLDLLLRLMRTTAFAQHPRQLVIVDACQADVPRHWQLPVHHYQDADLVRAFRQQDTLLAASPGQSAGNDDRNRTGRFSDAVLAELSWPDEGRFDELYQRVKARVASAEQQPARLAFLQDGAEQDVWRPRPAGPKVVPLTDLTAYRASAAASPGDGRPPVDERYRVRLDVACCLDRAPSLAVLAGAVEPDYAAQLAAALTAAEDHLAAAGALDPEAVRRWLVLTPSTGRPPATAEEIGAERGWLRAPVQGAVVTGLTDVRIAGEYLRAIRRLVPGLAVLAVAGPDRAARLARTLELPELLVAAFAPVETAGRPVPFPFPAGGALGALVAHLRAYGAQLPAVAGEPPAIPDEADPVAWAAQVVAELNDPGHPGYDEAALLTSARDRRPGLYPALLAQYAERRAAPGRLTSLTVAAGTDAELSYWLTHAIEPPDPTREMPAPEVVDALTVVLRRRSLEAAAPWAPYADRRVSDLVTLPAAAAPGLFATASAEVALLAIRCGLGEGVEPAAVEHGPVRPGAWALLVQHGITANTAKWLSGLDDHLRRLVGLRPEDLSVTDREALAAIRSALRPMLPLPHAA
ncbi:caspase family protein [Nucisporomicrobium flavum]|uniref:caspase family protein n=1 Tax=Nucisporomicrobium flavum TaxID=2785915 RepID=UPI0018F465A9|nr:caspase family protein [Nucisporomicrobium flavum]